MGVSINLKTRFYTTASPQNQNLYVGWPGRPLLWTMSVTQQHRSVFGSRNCNLQTRKLFAVSTFEYLRICSAGSPAKGAACVESFVCNMVTGGVSQVGSAAAGQAALPAPVPITSPCTQILGSSMQPERLPRIPATG